MSFSGNGDESLHMSKVKRKRIYERVTLDSLLGFREYIVFWMWVKFCVSLFYEGGASAKKEKVGKIVTSR